MFLPTASLTLMKNKLCFALEGPRVEVSELSNLGRCIAWLQKVRDTQEKLFAVIVLKRVKAHNAIHAAMYRSHRSDVKLLKELFSPPFFQTKADQG